MKKRNLFKIIFDYLKNDKGKVIIFILLTFFASFETLLYPIFWGEALEGLTTLDWNRFFINLLLWSGLALLCGSILFFPRKRLYNYLELKFMNLVCKDLYKKTVELPSIAYEEHSVGEFINRISKDPDRVMQLLERFIKVIARVISYFIVIFISLKVSYIITIEFIIFSIFVFIVTKFYFPKMRKNQEKIKVHGDTLVKEATQSLTGIREVKALGIKGLIKKITSHNIDNLFKEESDNAKNDINFHFLINLVYITLEFVIVFTCGYLYFNNYISLASFFMMESYIWKIQHFVQDFADFGVNYQKIIVSLARIDEIIHNRLYDDEKFGKVNLKNVKGNITFKNVDFKYNDDEELTLKDFNMELVPNKKIAIVGKSGMGKTTIFNILLRYFDVSKGEVLIDDVNIKDLSEKSLRDTISVIRQNPYIFNKTIRENFELVKENVTLKEIKEVCKKAYIDEYIESLPNKYDTLIGEGGINLSGGQKQRMAIARTLLKDTKIILFDEATSALDNKSQEYIKKTIDNLVKDHTVIIVAHRLSTIMDADIIYLIDEGKLKNYGTHQELMEKEKLYRTLYNPETLDITIN